MVHWSTWRDSWRPIASTSSGWAVASDPNCTYVSCPGSAEPAWSASGTQLTKTSPMTLPPPPGAGGGGKATSTADPEQWLIPSAPVAMSITPLVGAVTAERVLPHQPDDEGGRPGPSSATTSSAPLVKRVLHWSRGPAAAWVRTAA